MRMSGRIRWGSLSTQIIGWSFVPTAIILLAVAWVTFYAYQRVTEDLVVERNAELARLSAGQLSTELSQYTSLLESVAHALSLSDGGPTQVGNVLTQNANRLTLFDGGVVVVDDLGRVMGAEPERAGARNEDWSGRPYFRQLVRAPQPVFSNVAPGPDGSDVVMLLVPILNARGELLGAAVGMFRLRASAVSAFYGNILKLRLGESGSMYLVDGNGRIIYHSDDARIGANALSEPVVQQVLGVGVGSMRLRYPDHIAVAGFAPVPGTSWGLVTEDDLGVLLAPSNAYRNFLLVLIGLGLLVPAVVVMIGVRRITRPLQDMVTAAQAVAGGDFGHTIQAATGDELNALAVQFNNMSMQLQESYTGLETRVASRTRELEAIMSVTALMNQSTELSDVLQAAVDKTAELLRMEIGTAYRLEPGARTLTLVAQHGMNEEFVERTTSLASNPESARQVQQNLRPDVLSVAHLEESGLREELQRQGLELLVTIPLAAKGRVLGLLAMATAHARQITPEELSLLAGIGQQVGVAMENAQLHERAEEAAAAAERSRLARELHDAVTQTLFSASLIADVLPRIWERDPDAGQRRLVELRELTRGALAEMRMLLLELRPATLEEAPLGVLLKHLADAMTGRARVPVDLTVEWQDPLPPDVKVGFYRVAQEALNNIAKHSHATQVAVSVRCHQGIVSMAVRDDGSGFEPARVGKDRMGLGIMGERAESIGATLTVESAPDQGTEILMGWPLP